MKCKTNLHENHELENQLILSEETMKFIIFNIIYKIIHECAKYFRSNIIFR